MDADLQAKIDAAARNQYVHSMARCPYGADEPRREYARELAEMLLEYAEREPDEEPEEPAVPERPAPPVTPAPPVAAEPEAVEAPAPEDDAGEDEDEDEA